MSSLSSGILLQILFALEPLGLDVQRLLADIGLSESALREPDSWTSAEHVDALWNRAAELTNDRDFGLSAASLLRPSHLGAFGYVVAASANVSEAIARLVRFKRLTGDASKVEMRIAGNRVRYIHETAMPPLSSNRHHAEWSSASVVCLLREITGQPSWSPLEVTFCHPKPDDISAHKRVFGCTPTFSDEQDSVVMGLSFLSSPFLGAEKVLSQILEQHAIGLLAALPQQNEVLGALRVRLQKHLSGGSPTIEQLAVDMNLSVRSLQRRLEEQGLTFQQVLDEMRESLATVYLGNPSMAIAEAAYLLGYSDASAFSRAFKRWYQVTPSDWRRENA